jgi:hypothetical protein
VLAGRGWAQPGVLLQHDARHRINAQEERKETVTVRTICAILLLALLVAAPAMAAKVTSVPITHPPIEVFQAYPGNSTGIDLQSMGYAGFGPDAITSVPGVLWITPGTNWANFVGAAQAQVPYTIKNVVLRKQTPQIVQCADVFPVKTVSQQGTPNIRLWWPLMYEVPCTTWTLTILYGTSAPFDDDGPGPNPPAYVHTEVWQWHVNATLGSLSKLVELFHELPFGRDEVPLISDEVLYPILQSKIAATASALAAGDTVTASLVLGDFEMEVMDACIGVSPAFPNPTGPGTGIAETAENPACCKILADVEYIGKTTGILQPAK